MSMSKAAARAIAEKRAIRNQFLRDMHEHSLGIVRTAKESGIAACLLDALPDKRIAAATDISPGAIQNTITLMMRRAGVSNRVGLALALQRMILAP